jgi:hypothetical protein
MGTRDAVISGGLLVLVGALWVWGDAYRRINP